MPLPTTIFQTRALLEQVVLAAALLESATRTWPDTGFAPARPSPVDVLAEARNRLLGRVVFANAESESVTEQKNGRFERVVPATGAGLRVNINEVSHTNLSLDYGFGTDGSGACR